MSKASRDKGKAGEREVAAILTEWLGETVQRRLGQERDSGADIHVGRYAVQVKRVERLNLHKAMQQARDDCPEGMVPVVVSRASGRRWLLTVELEPAGLDMMRNGL